MSKIAFYREYSAAEITYIEEFVPIPIKRRIELYGTSFNIADWDEGGVVYKLPSKIKDKELIDIKAAYNISDADALTHNLNDMGTPEDIIQHFSEIWTAGRARTSKLTARNDWYSYWKTRFPLYATAIYTTILNYVPSTDEGWTIKAVVVITPVISGTVRAKATPLFPSFPLPFAKVTFSNTSTTTNTSGFYSLTGWIPISGPIKAELSGYETQTKNITAPETGTLTVDFELTAIAPPAEEQTESFWTKLYYSVADAKKIVAWIIANLKIPTFAQILQIVRGIDVSLVGAGYKVLPTPPAELKTKGRELYLQLDTALYNKNTAQVISILKQMAVTENNPIPILAVVVAVAGIVGTIITIIGSYPFSNFLREEALQTIDFAIMTARQNKDVVLYAKLIQFKEDLLERTLWEKILYAIPFVNIIEAAWDYYGAAKAKLEADKADFERFKTELEEEVAEKKGTLTISPIPADAKVSVTGQIPTTGTFSQILPIGFYSWVVSLYGYTSKSGSSEVKENLTTSVSITLQPVEVPVPKITKITISTSPPDTNIEIAAYPQITIPGTYEIAPGTYSIRIYKEGYKDYVATFWINEGDSKTLSITLALKEPYVPPVVPPYVPPEIPGIPEIPVTVPLEPTEPYVPPVYNAWKYTIKAIDAVTEQVLYAQLLVDGVSQEGYTPMSIYLLPESRYILTLRKKGYKQGVVEIITEVLPL